MATIGNEGIVGVPLVAGGSLAVRAISQVGGRSLRMDARAFATEFERLDGFRSLVQRYIQALFGQISQAAACNRLHSNEERLSRWLLMSHDRVGTDTFPITHEFLGQMLGSRRATVTLSAGLLQAAGLIKYHRGRVTIVDREGLEAVWCECYALIKHALDRVVVSLTDAALALGGGCAPDEIRHVIDVLAHLPGGGSSGVEQTGDRLLHAHGHGWVRVHGLCQPAAERVELHPDDELVNQLAGARADDVRADDRAASGVTNHRP